MLKTTNHCTTLHTTVHWILTNYSELDYTLHTNISIIQSESAWIGRSEKRNLAESPLTLDKTWSIKSLVVGLTTGLTWNQCKPLCGCVIIRAYVSTSETLLYCVLFPIVMNDGQHQNKGLCSSTTPLISVCCVQFAVWSVHCAVCSVQGAVCSV